MLSAAIAVVTLVFGVPSAPTGHADAVAAVGSASTTARPMAVASVPEAVATPTTVPPAVDDGTIDDDTVSGDTVTGDTVNEFLPEERGLGDCLGAVERPGCGSKARGGWRQGLVFLALVLGLTFIGWRIVRSARRRPTTEDATSGP